MGFSNLDGKFRAPQRWRVLKWMLGLYDKRPKSPATGVPVPYMRNDGDILRDARLDTLTWIGQASFLLQLGGTSVLIDPVLSSRLGWIRRNVLPGLDWASLPKIDAVLITHNHRDHMDAPTLKKLGKELVYFVPKGLGKWFRGNGFKHVVEMSWWQRQEIDGLSVTFVPSQHWSRRELNDLNESWWGGYVIEGNGLRLYHSGDTGWFEGFRQIGERCGKIDAAMLPIGAYEPRWFMSPQHIDPDEAMRAFKLLGAEYFIAMHWGTFKLSDEPLDEPPAVLREAWNRSGLPENRLKIPAIGETLLLDSLRS